MTTGNKFGSGAQRFGTGGDPPAVKTEGPGFLKTVFTGVAFGTGLLIVAETFKAIKKAWNSDDDEEARLKKLEEQLEEIED